MIDKHFLKHVKAAADTSPMHSYKLRVSQQIKKKNKKKQSPNLLITSVSYSM
jgi:hypothetical protein